ncbi:sulfatase-like hydrolase/transferase [Akkermansiaceae bacterium]|nr:sulfatase-like hydrolase/transferase [Akkermansiaceae bacterium]
MKLLAMTVACLSIISTSLAKEARPNIIFIFADDWGWEDLSCHDHPYIKTPNIDRLAKEGADFKRFTVASPVCSPSRTAVMTGHFPSRYLIDGHFAWVPSNEKRGMPDWVDPKFPSLPRMLQNSGYMTAHYGKWHLCNDMIPDGPSLTEYGYDDFGAFNWSGEQMVYDHDVKRSIAFIETAKKAEKPFFINLWIHEPHTPFHVLPKYRQQFPELTDEGDNIYAATLAYADERIGMLLDYLDDNNLTENTMVIFSSDNGPARNSKGKEPELIYDTATGAGFDTGASKGTTGGRKGYKGSLNEGGLNVPFLVRWPARIKPGGVDDQTLISAVDLLPTFCAITDTSMPEGYKPDGINYTQALLGTPVPKRETPLFSRYTRGGSPDHWATTTAVSGSYKYLTNKALGRKELYDLATDPLEKNDLAKEKPKVIASIEKEIEGWLSSLPKEPTGDVFSALRGQPAEEKTKKAK